MKETKYDVKLTSKDWDRIAENFEKKILELAKTPKGRLQIKRAGFNVPKKIAGQLFFMIDIKRQYQNTK